VRSIRNAIVLFVVALVAVLAFAATASAAPTWAPAATAPIHPGVQVFTNGAQCTANFVYYDASYVYLGQAAHCSSTGGSTSTNGCSTGTLPTGTAVQITGASAPGTMVYNSWATMQHMGESDPDTCQYNDLALIRLDPVDVARVNPSIPFWGGPTGTTGTVGQGQKVLSYGNSGLRAGVTQLSPKQGVELQQDSGGWNHTDYTATPGIPGDSGSAYIDAQGRAFGVLSTVQLAPFPAANGVGDVSRELSYLGSRTSFAVTLATGTEPFRGPLA
jgi:hypothetical protein